MNPQAIYDALYNRLRAIGPSLPPVEANVQSDRPRPYLEILPIIADRHDETLKGTSLREEGRLAANVVVNENTGTAFANGMAGAIAALFPKGLRLPFEGGHLEIHRPADIRGGFIDEAKFKVPIVIYYRAFAKGGQ